MPDTIPAVNCALISDLHLGILSGVDVARDPSVRARLVEAVSGADHVVLLGDVLEMRERRVADLLEIARPLFDELGEVTAGQAADRRARQPRSRPRGALARPPAPRRRRAGGRGRVDGRAGDGLLGRLAARMPHTHMSVAYPGLRVRPDVYVTHGHYLDVPLTVPRIESVAASVVARLAGPRATAPRPRPTTRRRSARSTRSSAGSRTAPATPRCAAGGQLSRRVWRQTNGSRRLGGPARWGGWPFPAPCSSLNRLGRRPVGGGHQRRAPAPRRPARHAPGGRACWRPTPST